LPTNQPITNEFILLKACCVGLYLYL